MQNKQRETLFQDGPALGPSEHQRVIDLLSAGMERLLREQAGGGAVLAIDGELWSHERDLTAGGDGSRGGGTPKTD
jgi:hypothetical protein